MRVRLDTCRPLVYRIGTGEAMPRPKRPREAARLVRSCLDAIQVFGGYGA
jgi:hypothetical protein